MATNKKSVRQKGELMEVRLGKMNVPPHAQRELNEGWVNKILADFDLDALGIPVVSERRGIYYILDGQHRIEALKKFLEADWEDSQILCRVLRNLSEREEAREFALLNSNKTVNSFDRFRIRANGGFETEVAVKRIVEAQGLTISRDELAGSIQAVSTAARVYTRSNEATLGKTLRLIRDGFGDAGFKAPVIDGVGHLCQRYNGLIDEKSAAKAFNDMRGGVGGLLNQAAALHEKVGGTRGHAIAATCVAVINRCQVRGKRLPSWWKDATSRPSEDQ